jgi:hypothetical protein
LLVFDPLTDSDMKRSWKPKITHGGNPVPAACDARPGPPSKCL